MSGPRIRPAQEADLAAIAAVQIAAHRAHLAPLDPGEFSEDEVAAALRQQWTSLPWEDFQEGPKGVILVAEEDGRLVGFVAAHLHDQEVPHVFGFFVLPEHQGRGTGRRLGLALVEDLVTRGFPRARGFTRVGNTRTLEIYARAGATLGEPVIENTYGGKGPMVPITIEDLAELRRTLEASLPG